MQTCIYTTHLCILIFQDVPFSVCSSAFHRNESTGQYPLIPNVGDAGYIGNAGNACNTGNLSNLYCCAEYITHGYMQESCKYVSYNNT